MSRVKRPALYRFTVSLDPRVASEAAAIAWLKSLPEGRRNQGVVPLIAAHFDVDEGGMGSPLDLRHPRRAAVARRQATRPAVPDMIPAAATASPAHAEASGSHEGPRAEVVPHGNKAAAAVAATLQARVGESNTAQPVRPPSPPPPRTTSKPTSSGALKLNFLDDGS